MNQYRQNQNESQAPSGAENKEFSGVSSFPGGPFYRSLPFDSFSASSEQTSTSHLPFEPPKYRSLGFDGVGGGGAGYTSSPLAAPSLLHDDSQYHALNSQTDRSVDKETGGVDLSMPSFRSGPTAVQALNPKAGASEWGQESVDFQMPALKGLKDLPPVALGYAGYQPSQPIQQQQQKTRVSPLQQNLDLVQSAPAPPELPIQFEIYSSFWSASSSSELWSEILKYMHANLNADFVFQAKRNKVKATIVQNGYSIQFNVRVFGKPSKDSGKWNSQAVSLVECQRRSGDAFEFNAFYKGMVEAVKKADKNLFLAEASPVAQKQLPVPLAPIPLSLAPPTLKSEVTLDADTRKALYSMAVATQNTGAQREALRALAKMSAQIGVNQFLTSQDAGEVSADEEISLEQVLHCSLTSRDSEVRRCASTLLANISRQQSAQNIMSAALINKLFALLEQEHLDTTEDKPEAKLPEYMTAETKRQVARAISGLSTLPASCKIMASQPDYVRLLRQQTELSADSRLGIYADAAVQRLTPQMGIYV